MRSTRTSPSRRIRRSTGGKYGDTTYYFFETENLPLYGPLRSIGVPEPLIDIVEPLSIFVVELGYRRDIPPYVPSPARLIPVQDPAKVVDDFFAAVDETIDNTLAVLGSPPALSIPAPSARTAVPHCRTSTMIGRPDCAGPRCHAAGTEINNEDAAGTTTPDSGTPGQTTAAQTEQGRSAATTHPLGPLLRGPIGIAGAADPRLPTSRPWRVRYGVTDTIGRRPGGQ